VSYSAAPTFPAVVTPTRTTPTLAAEVAVQESIIPPLSLDISLATPFSTTHASSPSRTIRRDEETIILYQKAQDFIRIATVRDRYYHMRRYPNVFVGSEVVTALVEQGICPTRSDAVQLGRQLERELCLFNHVVNDHRFDDKWYFYRYHRNHRLRNMLLTEQNGEAKQSTNKTK
jgi:hypothetical protein